MFERLHQSCTGALRLVMFDLDGTLVDSLPDLHASCAAMLQDLGHPAPSAEAVSTWVGNGARQLVEEFAGRVENKPIKVGDASIANHLLKTFHFDAINADLIDSTEDSVVVRAVHSVTEESLQFWFQRSTFEEEKLP